MKAIARKVVDQKMAIEIAEGIIDSLAGAIKDAPVCQCEDRCSCSARYWDGAVTDAGLYLSPDYYGSSAGVTFPAQDTMCLTSITCGGHTHELIINILSGEITASHEGARSSCGAMGFDFIPDLYWYEVAHHEGWKLVEYETSEPSWGVEIALIKGQFGTGPCSAQEADHVERERIEREIREFSQKIRLEMPEFWHYDIDYGLVSLGAENAAYDEDDSFSLSSLMKGEHYRRMAAQGIKELPNIKI